MEGYIGEIRLFAGNYAPLGWAFCDGTLYSIATYTATFSILGTIYGGDGHTTFAVPDLRGRIAVGTGTGIAAGVAFSNITLGEMGGKESVTMTSLQMPAHNHSATATIRFPASVAGGGEAFTSGSILGGMQGAYSSQAADTYLAPESATSVLSTVGSNIPFDIIQPVMAANYIICLEGIYPSRN